MWWRRDLLFLPPKKEKKETLIHKISASSSGWTRVCDGGHLSDYSLQRQGRQVCLHSLEADRRDECTATLGLSPQWMRERKGEGKNTHLFNGIFFSFLFVSWQWGERRWYPFWFFFSPKWFIFAHWGLREMERSCFVCFLKNYAFKWAIDGTVVPQSEWSGDDFFFFLLRIIERHGRRVKCKKWKREGRERDGGKNRFSALPQKILSSTFMCHFPNRF